MEPRISLKKPGKLLFSVTVQAIFPHPMKSPRTIAPRFLPPPQAIAPELFLLDNILPDKFPHEIPPRAFTFVQLPLHNFVFKKTIENCFDLSCFESELHLSKANIATGDNCKPLIRAVDTQLRN